MAVTGSVAAPTDYPVRFLGTGSEYFRIWIVNLLLTIVTLGIYSAWAKVRRLKYMYRNTQIADSSFDYHGSPIAILKGRLVALVLLIAYNFSFQLSLIVGVVTLAFLAAIFPWLIRQSLRFRARYSSYRGIHFQFVGGLAEIYLIAAPLIFCRAFCIARLLRGRQNRAPGLAHHIARIGDFYLSCIAAVFALPIQALSARQYPLRVRSSALHRDRRKLLRRLWNRVCSIPRHRCHLRLVFAAAGAGIFSSGADASTFGIGLLLLLIAIYAAYFLLFAAFVVLIQNRVWNHTTVGEVSFRSNARVLPMARIYLVNIVLLIVTLGLFTPFAVIRSHKYRLESVTAVTVTGMDQFWVARRSTRLRPPAKAQPICSISTLVCEHSRCALL